MSDFKLTWGGAHLTAEVIGACKESIKQGAEKVAKDARELCPKDSGELVSTIAVSDWQKDDAVGAYVKAGGDDLGHVARFVELGTPGTVFKNGARKGAERQPIVAQPYLRPALKKNKQAIINQFKGRLK